jgi:hypothetical protein
MRVPELNRCFRFVLLIGGVVFLCGCAAQDSGPPPDGPVDIVGTEGLEAKKMALDFAAGYKKNAEAAQEELGPMLENLEGFDSADSEPVSGIIAALTALSADCDQSKVDELVKLAEAIPGDISELEEEGDGDGEEGS